jgi:hypothetical protein
MQSSKVSVCENALFATNASSRISLRTREFPKKNSYPGGVGAIISDRFGTVKVEAITVIIDPLL